MHSFKSTLCDYTVSEENVATYRELCKRLLKSSSIFRYTPPELESPPSQGNHKKRSHPTTSVEKTVKESPSKKRKANPSPELQVFKKASEIPITSDIKSLQKSFISSLNNINADDVKLFKSVEPMQVCASDSSVISDEILIQVCKKSEKADDNVASIIGTLIVLPKMYHLSSKLPLLSCDAICDYVRWHPKIAVIHALVPFLQHCPVTQEQHRDLVVQLTEHCATPLLTHLLRALSSRDAVSEVDLQVFQHLCKKADPEAESTHTAVLAFLGKALKNHQSSVKYGQCLLFIVKQMGQHMKDEETLQSVVDGHTSGMRKAIQIHLKKTLKNR